MAVQMSSEFNEDNDVINSLRPPSNYEIQICESKNKLHRYYFANDYSKYGDSWKETVGILRQRLELANKMKETALKDSEKLKNQIKKHDTKLKELNDLQQKLTELEQHYKTITNENHILRQNLHKVNVMIQEKNNELRKKK
eukprot:484786_1